MIVTYTEALPASCLSRRAALAGASVRAVIPVLSSPPAPAPLRPVPAAPASMPQQMQQQMQQQMHEVGSMSVDSETRSYKNLQPLRISSPSMPLPVDPGLRHGHLPCGLAYYIKKNRKPEQVQHVFNALLYKLADVLKISHPMITAYGRFLNAST
eukprot:5016081-Pleurochrysis_carterae.AAC.4